MLKLSKIVIKNRQGTEGPSKGQGHLLSCSGQLKRIPSSRERDRLLESRERQLEEAKEIIDKLKSEKRKK